MSGSSVPMDTFTEDNKLHKSLVYKKKKEQRNRANKHTNKRRKWRLENGESFVENVNCIMVNYYKTKFQQNLFSCFWRPSLALNSNGLNKRFYSFEWSPFDVYKILQNFDIYFSPNQKQDDTMALSFSYIFTFNVCECIC